MLKYFLKFSVIFVILIVFVNIASANPQLKIKDTDFSCEKNLLSKGYNGCTLHVDLMLEDYSYSDKYDKYTYNVECKATFSYLSAGSYISGTNYETDYIKIYGTNRRKTLDIYTGFMSLNPVYKVNVSELTCKVKDIY